MKFYKTIQFRLMVIILSIIILSNGVLTIISSRYSKTAIQNTVNQVMDTLAESISDKINSFNAKNFLILDAVAELDFIKDENIPAEEKSIRLRSLAKVSPQYENITYFDEKGNGVTFDGRPVNMASREYMKQAIAGNRYASEPLYSEVVQRLLMTYAIPVYGANSKKIIGVTAANVYGETLSNLVANITVGKNSHPIVVSRKSKKIVASAILDDVIKGDPIDITAGAEQQVIINGMLSGMTSGGGFTDAKTKTMMTAAYAPIEGTDWSAMMICPYDDFFGKLSSMSRIMTVSFILTIAIAFAICWMAISSALKPLNKVRSSIEDIASGDADLRKRIEGSIDDEVGAVINGFNKFAGKMQEIISKIKTSKEDLGTAGSDLLASTEDTGTSIAEILTNIDSVHQQITAQSNSVQQTAGAVNEIASNIESLETMIQRQTAGVSEASAAVEQMIGNIRSVTTSMEKMSGSFGELTKSAQSGSQLQSDVYERIEQIKALSETLQEANSAIANIAEQTNLLAMNAAIEAAHAGEAGKGFSVVADEIRKLSETSSTQSKTIGDQLTNIQNSIAGVVTASEQSNAAFQAMTKKIAETDQLVRQIRAAMEEQNQGSQQISSVLHNMNDSSLEVRNAGEEMMEGNKAILEEVRTLQDATGVMQSSMDVMQTSARKINETGAALRGIANNMKNSIENIGSQIDQFKV